MTRRALEYSSLTLVIAALCLAPLSVGCVPAMIPPTAHLSSPGVEIVSPSFQLKEKTDFNIPFSLNKWRVDGGRPIVEAYRGKLAEGAVAVRVKAPSREEPFYGVLSFHKIPSDASGPGTRSYSLSVGDQYFQDATDGKVSVVYELVSKGDAKYYAWVLWISDRPL